jgi:hypothetical protein
MFHFLCIMQRIFFLLLSPMLEIRPGGFYKLTELSAVPDQTGGRAGRWSVAVALRAGRTAGRVTCGVRAPMLAASQLCWLSRIPILRDG